MSTLTSLADPSACASVQVEALRSVIVLSARRTFAYTTVQSKRLLVGVFLEHPIDSPRVLEIDHVSVRKFGSVIDVRGPGDVDDELQLWLRQAYELCSPGGTDLS